MLTYEKYRFDKLRFAMLLTGLVCLAGCHAQENQRVARLDWRVQNKSDDDLKPLSQYKNLVYLHLDGNPLTGEGLKYLKDLPELRVLTLNQTDVTDAGLKHLSQIKSLHRLEFGNTLISDKGLEFLQEIPELSGLLIKGTNTTGEGLQNLKSLSDVDLTGTSITDDSLKYLSKSRMLSKLNLTDTDITGAGFRHFNNIFNLRLQYAADLERKRRSMLNETRLRSRIRVYLPENVEYTEKITRDYLFNACREVLKFDLILKNTQFNDESMKHLKKLPHLHRLVLKGTQVTGKGLESLDEHTVLSELNVLKTVISSEDLKEFQRLHPNCEVHYPEQVVQF